MIFFGVCIILPPLLAGDRMKVFRRWMKMAFLACLPCGGYAGDVHSDDPADASGKLEGEHFFLSGFEDFQITWSATFQTAEGANIVLNSTDGSAGSMSPGPSSSLSDTIQLLFDWTWDEEKLLLTTEVGIRNTGDKAVKLVSVTPLQAEWKLPTNLDAWFITGFHPATPLVHAVRDAYQPVRIHEHGGCYHSSGNGFFFGPFGKPVAYLDARFARLGEDRMYFSYTADMSGARVDPGETRWGQQVVLWMRPPREAFPRWAEAIGESHQARNCKAPVTGWGSWYSFGQKVTDKDLLGQLETVRKNRDRLRPDVILIDKGHEQPGNFPEGISSVANAVKGAGMRSGLRLELNGLSDPCLPVRNAVRDGFCYLKLGDFQARDTYRDPRLTEFEMRRKLYSAIREAAGPDTYLLNAPLYLDRASVGYVDASRTGRTAWRNDVVPAMDDVLRSYDLHGHWFAIDNDHFYLGTDIANVSEIAGGWPVVRTWMSMTGLSCGLAFTSDPLNLESVEPFWRNLEVMTPPAREATEVLDLGRAWKWPRLVGHVRRDWGDATVALLWNPEKKEKTVQLDFKNAGMNPNQRYAVWSFWDNRYLGISQEFWNTPSLAPSASQHLRFTPIQDSSEPVLIGSNLHIYCGAAEIREIRSSGSSMTIDLTDAGARAGDLFVYSRFLPVLRSAAGLMVTDIDQAGENVWRIRMRDRQHGSAQRIELSFLLPVTRQWWFWGLIGLVIAGFITAGWRYVVSLRLQRRLALDEERARISRDLHDGMGANLTQIALVAEMASRQPGLIPAAREHLDRIVASTHSLAGELDSVVWATNPGNDTVEHFVQYLEHHAQSFLEVAGVRLRIDVPSMLPDIAIGSATRHNLFLAAKEALNNVVRHAQASCVTLRIRILDHALGLEIEDDGCGIGDRCSLEPGADGLPNMTNRMARINGRCEAIPGKNGRGTLVRFIVPLRGLDSSNQP
ncbi:MAG: hypothetical protein RLZ97_65 [Verrucomicrobiota bacterium]